jgi:hypothetical protein
MTVMGTPNYMIFYKKRKDYKSEGPTLIKVYDLQLVWSLIAQDEDQQQVLVRTVTKLGAT